MRFTTWEKCTVVDDPSELRFDGENLHVSVRHDQFIEEVLWSDDREEYRRARAHVERRHKGTETDDISLRLINLQNEDDPVQEFAGPSARRKVQETLWDSYEILDVETVRFSYGGQTFTGSFDTSPLSKYR